MDAAVPESLLRAVQERQLMVLAGSGISVLAPSYLPDWRGFNEALLDGVKDLALTFPGLSEDAESAIRGLTLDSLAVEAFSDAVVDAYAGEEYFPILKILDSTQPNANHRALAELARQGVLRAVVTTNFDTLLEQAFAGLPFETCITAEDYARVPRDCDRPVIYKIHGSVTSTTTLVDTVSQKLGGLALHVRERLATLFGEAHTLVLGFSGGDLKFGEDYLPLSAIPAQSAAITWVIRPGTKLSENVQAVLKRAGSKPCKGELPGFFRSLGIVVEAAAEEQEGNFEEANRRARAQVAQWNRDLDLGEARACVFCLTMLRTTGQTSAALALARRLALLLDHAGEVHSEAVVNLLSEFARLAVEVSDFENADQWARRTLRCIQEIEDRYAREKRPLPDHMRAWRDRVSTGAWSAIGLKVMAHQQYDDALMPLREATRFARSAGNGQLLSAVCANRAYLAEKLGLDADRVLLPIRAAASSARKARSAQVLAEAAHFEARNLAGLAEYHAAHEAVARGLHYAALGASARAKMSLDTAAAVLEIRRGRTDKALQKFLGILNDTQDNVVAAAQFRILMVKSLEFATKTRPALVEALDWVLERIHTGAIPPDLGVPSEYSEQKIRSLRDKLAAGEVPSRPWFLDAKSGEREDLLRAEIAAAEYHGDRRSLPGRFAELCRLKSRQMRPWRLHDLACELLALTEAGGSRKTIWNRLIRILRRTEKLRLEGIAHRGFANSLLGHWKGALADFEEVLGSRRALPDSVIRHCRRNLGHLRMALGDRECAARLLEDPRYATAREGHPEGAPRRLIIFAGHLSITPEEARRLRTRVESSHELYELAARAAESGLNEMALEFVLDAQAQAVEGRDIPGASDGLTLLAELMYRRGRPDNAYELMQQALEIASLLDDNDATIRAFAFLAYCYLRTGDVDKALNHATQCEEYSRNAPYSRWMLLATYVFAQFQSLLGSRVVHRFVEVYDAIADHDEFEPEYTRYKQLLGATGRHGAVGS
jgi:tetratricopeptide (TPR) repeat protein